MFKCFSKKTKQFKSLEKRVYLNEILVSSSKRKGLANFGNTCYINSILHCLFSLKAFRNIIEGSKISVETPILYSLKKLIHNLEKKKSKKYYKGFIQMIKKVTNPRFL